MLLCWSLCCSLLLYAIYPAENENFENDNNNDDNFFHHGTPWTVPAVVYASVSKCI